MSAYSYFAKHYDRLTENIDYRRRAEYFNTLLRRFGEVEGNILLDLACGTGSLSIALCQLGYDVIGVDASADMLSVAMGKGAGGEKPILFLNQAMSALDLYGTVDYTVCALDSLNHLPNEHALDAAIARVSLFTVPGGLFLFDVNTAYKHQTVLGDNIFVYDLENLYCVWRNEYHAATQRVDIRLDFFEREGDHYYRHWEEFSEWIYPHETLVAHLERNGFSLLVVFGDDTFDEPRETAQRLVYVAKKIT